MREGCAQCPVLRVNETKSSADLGSNYFLPLDPDPGSGRSFFSGSESQPAIFWVKFT